MPIINGKTVLFCNASSALECGFLTSSEYYVSMQFEFGRALKGLYVPKMIYVDGVYKCVTREHEKLPDLWDRLKL